ncbi:NmrA family NAD(P)-binding protein [Sulfitobacter donghicola]|uniref:Epimerase n=1 Tax=Sulfitobacter donghicola DSW-25 = KCTC 12864 = JCM 14565 TaxID=1300350 RepID=A0A073IHM7_9RHOB|nr:NAD-dependent epimerase/dehydratase family protein [Sulfitobacter donghicola]KEJ89848.1 epimerase [Sulfitobacter donghicola DSW-25 = KCTC 12864 = JCM 14565]KIN67031.1 Nucleoside-diphosphate-sugar epimerase [Sulfitobacter donghicola DSW-25 = KCTC 12864 = JCM 14565]
MTKTVLVLGANGRFGRAAVQAFLNEGWNVRAATRNGEGQKAQGLSYVACDVAVARQVVEAAMGVDVIVHAVHPPYPKWAEIMPVHTANVITAGLASGATVMIPGNVYSFGKDTNEVLREDAAPCPSTRKGVIRVAMEQAFAKAAEKGLQTIILRGGDYIERRQTGNWFDSHITNKVHKGIFTYPGKMDVVHAWAYLPDMARAMAGLAAIRSQFPRFSSYGFEGYSLTGEQLMAAVAKASGRQLKLKYLPWPILRALALVSPLLREVCEMRYLWDTPHRIDGEPLRKVLPDFEPTSLLVAMDDALAHGKSDFGFDPERRMRSA